MGVLSRFTTATLHSAGGKIVVIVPVALPSNSSALLFLTLGNRTLFPSVCLPSDCVIILIPKTNLFIVSQLLLMSMM